MNFLMGADLFEYNSEDITNGNNRYKLLINMAKFKQFLIETGDELINKRAENLTEETKQEFEDQKRLVEKKIRNIKNNIVSMEDLSVRNTQTLVVGENLNTKEWVNQRINYALELRDLNVELDTINALIKEYFD